MAGLTRDGAGFSAAGLLGREAERFWVGAAVVLGQGLAEGAGPVGDGAAADLAACDRQMGDGDREVPGMCLAHFLLLCHPYRAAPAPWLRVACPSREDVRGDRMGGQW